MSSSDALLSPSLSHAHPSVLPLLSPNCYLVAQLFYWVPLKFCGIIENPSASHFHQLFLRHRAPVLPAPPQPGAGGPAAHRIQNYKAAPALVSLTLSSTIAVPPPPSYAKRSDSLGALVFRLYVLPHSPFGRMHRPGEQYLSCSIAGIAHLSVLHSLSFPDPVFFTH